LKIVLQFFERPNIITTPAQNFPDDNCSNISKNRETANFSVRESFLPLLS